MNQITKFIKNIADNLAEIYTLLLIVIALPVTVGFITEAQWGILLSLAVQSVLGVLYIKGSEK